MNLRMKFAAGVALATLVGGSMVVISGAASATSAPHGAIRIHSAGSANLPAPLPGFTPAAVSGYTEIGSYNWSGYAQWTTTDGTFKGVADTWTVPTVNTSLSGDQFSSDWVGVGGFEDNSLVQDGTEADNINGHAHYDAWTEILPAAEVVLPDLPIHPGDQIYSITIETGHNVWDMEVMDLTTGQSGSRSVHYDSSGASIETVHERPCIADDCTSLSDLANLTDTTNVTFDPGLYTTSYPGSLEASYSTAGWTPLMSKASGATVYRMFMVNDTDSAVIASPSTPSTDREGFSVAYGATPPPAP
jgi:hypothetical protein